MMTESKRDEQKQLSFDVVDRVEEESLIARLDAVRAAIDHAGEKGRGLEHEVARLVGSFLPRQYGVATGFVAFRGDSEIHLSCQLDAIIYDSVRGGPLAKLGSCMVLPLKSALGYIEVKA
jgi:hypothetical protein